MKVWITRTDTSAAKSADAVLAKGYVPLIGPLLHLSPVSTPHAAPPETSALAFTSGNGVRAFTALTDRRHWQTYAVGEATAKLLRAAGFEHVHVAGGDVDALAALIMAQKPEDIVHLSGVHIAGDLVETLTQSGLSAQRTIIYATQAAHHLTEDVVMAINSGEPLAVFLYSPKAALVFVNLLMNAGLKERFVHLDIISISKAVDAVLGEYEFGVRKIADRPDEQAMIAVLEIMASKA